LPDHFPGRPIVPGALLLDHVIAAGRHAGLPVPREVVVAKFMAVARPDAALLARFEDRTDGKIRLTCYGEADGATVLSAVLDCRDDPAGGCGEGT
jgi:3-hydroxymyristoyl/3-hydroxydecanoyl-(acyl carrier protein) dehydratase